MGKPTKTIDDFQPEVLDLFDQLVHGQIQRREFLAGAAKYTVGGLTATALLDNLSPVYADTAEVAADDPAVVGEYIIYPSPQNWQAYVVRPAIVSGELPAVLVIHENRGRNPYIEDVTRRMAKAGFLAIAPDALTSFGGWPGDDGKGRELQRQLDRMEMLQNFLAAFEFAKAHPLGNGKVGAVGFCYGGAVVNFLATQAPDLAAGVPFYGRQPPLDLVPDIRAPMLIQNAELDKRILEGAKAYEDAMTEAGVNFESHTYSGASHGFHNNTTPRYDDSAANLAWQRTLDFFNRHLK